MKKTEMATLQIHINRISEARDWCEDYKSELEESFSAKSEKWQESESGQEAQSLIDSLDDLYNTLDNAADELDGILQDAQ